MRKKSPIFSTILSFMAAFLLFSLPAFAQSGPIYITKTGATTSRNLAGLFTFSPLDFGAVGNGSSIDTAAVQAAISASANNELDLGSYIYLVGPETNPVATLPLIVSSPIMIKGVGGNPGIYSGNCVKGFKTSINNQTLFAFNTNGAQLQDTCLQMASTTNANTSGNAITIGVGANDTVQDVQINYPYLGIYISGNGTQQNVNSRIDENTILNPSNGGFGIYVGGASTGGSTVDTQFIDNEITCSAVTSATGIAITDAGGFYWRGNDVFGCGTGMSMTAGTNQYVQGYLYDVIGDTSSIHDLSIDTSAPTGVVSWLKFTNTWTSSASLNPVVVANHGGGTVSNIIFNGHHGIFRPTASGAVGMQFQAGNNIVFNGSEICSQSSGIAGLTGLEIGASVQNITVSSSIIGVCGGPVVTTGIKIDSGAQLFNITNNNLGETTNPIQYTPNNETAIVGGNIGLDNIAPSVAAASSITLPDTPLAEITGTATINSILNSAWSNRQVQLVTGNSAGLSFGTGGNICHGPLSFPVNTPAFLTWKGDFGCWLVK